MPAAPFPEPHPMRRKKQELPYEETLGILRRATSGVLAVAGDDGYPYAVPLSFAVEEVPAAAAEAAGSLRLYFHCAPAGRKLDCIAACDRASFCVVGADDVVPERFTTYFRSAVAFGRVRVVGDDGERLHALRLLAAKYAPGLDEGFAREVETSFDRTCVLRLDVEALTGKEAIELVRERALG